MGPFPHRLFVLLLSPLAPRHTSHPSLLPPSPSFTPLPIPPPHYRTILLSPSLLPTFPVPPPIATRSRPLSPFWPPVLSSSSSRVAPSSSKVAPISASEAPNSSMAAPSLVGAFSKITQHHGCDSVPPPPPPPLPIHPTFPISPSALPPLTPCALSHPSHIPHNSRIPDF